MQDVYLAELRSHLENTEALGSSRDTEAYLEAEAQTKSFLRLLKQDRVDVSRFEERLRVVQKLREGREQEEDREALIGGDFEAQALLGDTSERIEASKLRLLEVGVYSCIVCSDYVVILVEV